MDRERARPRREEGEEIERAKEISGWWWNALETGYLGRNSDCTPHRLSMAKGLEEGWTLSETDGTPSHYKWSSQRLDEPGADEKA